MILKLLLIGVVLILLEITDVEGIAEIGSGGAGVGGSNGSGINDNGSCGGNSNLKVSIPIDSANQDTITFIRNSVQPIFDEFSSCIQWDLIPCSTSCIVQAVSQCQGTIKECRVDALYACASNYFKDQPNNVAKFLLCMMTSENQMSEGQKCANQAQIDWNQLLECKPCSEAGQLCENRYNLLTQIHQPNTPKVMFNLVYDCELEQNAIKNLKGTICDQLKQNNMQCSACDGCGNGGGGGGGEKDYGLMEAPPGTPNFQFFENGKYFSYNGFLLPNNVNQLD